MSYMFCCYIKIYRRFISYNTSTLFDPGMCSFCGNWMVCQKTEDVDATDPKVWIGKFNVKVRKTIEHILPKTWYTAQFCKISAKQAHLSVRPDSDPRRRLMQQVVESYWNTFLYCQNNKKSFTRPTTGSSHHLYEGEIDSILEVLNLIHDCLLQVITPGGMKPVQCEKRGN